MPTRNASPPLRKPEAVSGLLSSLGSALQDVYGVRGGRSGSQISRIPEADAASLRRRAEQKNRILSRPAWDAWWNARRQPGDELAHGPTSEPNVVVDPASNRVVKVTRLDELSDGSDGQFGRSGATGENDQSSGMNLLSSENGFTPRPGGVPR